MHEIRFLTCASYSDPHAVRDEPPRGTHCVPRRGSPNSVQSSATRPRPRTRSLRPFLVRYARARGRASDARPSRHRPRQRGHRSKRHHEWVSLHRLHGRRHHRGPRRCGRSERGGLRSLHGRNDLARGGAKAPTPHPRAHSDCDHAGLSSGASARCQGACGTRSAAVRRPWRGAYFFVPPFASERVGACAGTLCRVARSVSRRPNAAVDLFPPASRGGLSFDGLASRRLAVSGRRDHRNRGRARAADQLAQDRQPRARGRLGTLARRWSRRAYS